VNASFIYDGLRRREKKTINGNLTEFLFDGINPVQETSGATILAHVLPGLGTDEFLTRTEVSSGTTSYFLADALGSPVALTDAAGAVQTEYVFEPFGKTIATGASNPNSYQYTGRENDGTGLYYYRARYYHPHLQRFISEDPIGFGGGDINLGAFVRNNPTNSTDPTGEILSPSFTKWSKILIFVGRLFLGGSGAVPPPPPPRITQTVNRPSKPILKGMGKAAGRGIMGGLVGSIVGDLIWPDDAGAGSDLPSPLPPPAPTEIIDVPPGDDDPGPMGGRKDDDCPWDVILGRCGPVAQ
jgi:RHS repeat-associated protein